MSDTDSAKVQLLVVRTSIAAFKPFTGAIEARKVMDDLSKAADVVAVYMYVRPNMGSAYRLTESFQR